MVKAKAIEYAIDNLRAHFNTTEAEYIQAKDQFKALVEALDLADKRISDLKRTIAYKDLHLSDRDNAIAVLGSRIAALEKGYSDAIEEIGTWGAYASPYFQEKWSLPEIIADHKAILEKKSVGQYVGDGGDVK